MHQNLAQGAGKAIRIVSFSALATAFFLTIAAPGSTAAETEWTVFPQSAELFGPNDRMRITASSAGPGDQLDLTRSAKYSSSAKSVASVSALGEVTPHGDGDAVISVEHGGTKREVSIHVSEFGNSAVSFENDVMPILNRARCNGGACHASQFGKAGFKLSLFGYAPEQDYGPITRDSFQRRISRNDPANSLLLLKPTGQTAHGGGRRLAIDSFDYTLLLDWIAEGAVGSQKDEPTVVQLTVHPTTRVYQPGQSQQLRVTAVYSNDRIRDVTHLAQYDMLGSVGEVSEQGLISARQSGQSAVMVRFMGQAKISNVIVPFTEQVDLSGFQVRNFVDQQVMRRWRQLGLRPSAECSDEVFVRRAFLDAIGTLPTSEEVERFVASDEKDKHEALVDGLLGLTGDPKKDLYVEPWSAYWTLKWGDLIRNNRNKLGDGGMWALHNWMRNSLRENVPVDQLVRELITAQGSVFESGPANFFKVTNKPDELAEATAQTFLGIRMQCAKCHHHPFEVYSQADYYGLAAFFTRVGSKGSNDFGALGGDTVVMVKRSGSIRHPRTGKTMEPRFLRGEVVDANTHRDLRRPLAAWLTSPQNRLFSRNIANRYWSYLMGVGLVEPIDDMRETNPPSNPELLDALADHLVESGFDLRKLMRAIMTSTAYRLTSAPLAENANYERFHTHYNVRRLPAEVLLDAINRVCGVGEKFTGIPSGTRAIELPDPNFPSFFLDTMGRPKRVITCECERTSSPNLAQVLHILNGDFVSQKIANKQGTVAKLLKEQPDDNLAVDSLFLSAFARRPSELERKGAHEVIAAAENRQEGMEDLCWALLNSREFFLNH